LLCRIVREYILPQLKNQVEVEEICTIHNPIRVVRVDGRPVVFGDNYSFP
jgi:hypothetical protein